MDRQGQRGRTGIKSMGQEMSRWGGKRGSERKDEVRGHTVPSVEGMGLRPSKDPFSVHCSVEFPLLGEESAMGHLIG